MKSKFLGFNLDFIGFTASILCAIHCAALPLFIALSASSGSYLLENELLEFVLIAGSVALAGASVFKGYSKHKNTKPIIYILIGFIFLIAGHIFHSLAFEVITILIGAFLIAFAHVINWRLSNKSCRTLS